MEFELKNLTYPLSEQSPSGENCEYDPLYTALEELSVGVPESQMGDSIIEGKDPDWRQVQKNCLALWKKTRDLRVAAYLTISGLVLDGFAGMSDGISLMDYLVTDLWDTFWPQLDPDDDNDPLERMNIFAMISPEQGAYDDKLNVLTKIRNLRLVPVGPAYTLRDLMIAEGELDIDDSHIDLNLLQAEMLTVPAEELQKQDKLVQNILDKLQHISTVFEEKTNSFSVSFSLLINELKKIKRFYLKFVNSGNENSDVNSAENSENSQAAFEGAVTISRPVQGARIDIGGYKVQSRSEALIFLRKGCEYFQSAEPTSPVPYLINRALRMAEMNFLDLLTEIDPNSLERGRDILGVRQTDSESGDY